MTDIPTFARPEVEVLNWEAWGMSMKAERNRLQFRVKVLVEALEEISNLSTDQDSARQARTALAKAKDTTP